MSYARWQVWLGVLLVALGCTGRPRKAGSADPSDLLGAFPGSAGKLVEIDLTGGAPEALESGLFPLPPQRTYAGLVEVLEQAARDDRTSGVLVLLGGAELGFAHVEEVGRLLAAVRQRGRPVVCHAHQLGNATTWLVAVGCDRIWLSPAGGVDTVGLAAQTLYFKGALDRFKVRADFIAVGDYKAAVEAFLREGPSEQAREDLVKTFASLRKSWLDGMRAGRGRIAASVEAGPWSPEEAMARGIVDAIGYESDATNDAKTRAKADAVTPTFGPRARASDLDLGELIRVLSGTDGASGGRPRIALVPAVGAIAMASEGGIFEGGGISEHALTKVLRRLKQDDSVKAVVLRIDSPGGSALASDLLWNELQQLRAKKPLVVSVGGMAASGGYYMACAGTEIIAERTSIVGSIGVFGGKLTFDEGLADLGVNAVTFPASDAPGAAARAAYLSPFMRWDDPTRARVRASMKSVYDLFLRRVAAGRSMKVEAVHRIAEGRIWSGAQGKDIGLVDRFGGLSVALERARELGKLDADAPVALEGTGETLLELLTLDEAATRAEIEAALVRLQASHARVRGLVPDEVRPFVAALNPLLQGEHTLAALPFALVVE